MWARRAKSRPSVVDYLQIDLSFLFLQISPRCVFLVSIDIEERRNELSLSSVSGIAVCWKCTTDSIFPWITKFTSCENSSYSHCSIRLKCHVLVSSPTSWRNMGRSRSKSYSPSRRDRSPVRRRSRRDDDGPRRKFWRGRDLGPRFSSAPTSLLVRNIARDSRHSNLPTSSMQLL